MASMMPMSPNEGRLLAQLLSGAQAVDPETRVENFFQQHGVTNIPALARRRALELVQKKGFNLPSNYMRGGFPGSSSGAPEDVDNSFSRDIVQQYQ